MKSLRNLFFLLSVSFFAPKDLTGQWHKKDLKYTNHLLYPQIHPTSVHFSAADNGYIVTDNGVLHFNGKQWIPVSTGQDVMLKTVFTVNKRNTFFAGFRGTLLRYDGTTSRNYKLDSSVTLNSIFMIDSANGWAAGKKGKMYKISGDTAIYYPVDYATEICGIYFDNPYHGWAVGYDGPDMYNSSFFGKVYEYKNGEWHYPSIFIDDKLNAITTTPGGIIYIAGNKGLYTINRQANILEPVPNTQSSPLLSLSMANDSFGVAVGEKNYLIFSNKKWESFKAEYADMRTVFCVDTGNVWCTSYKLTTVSNGLPPVTYDIPKTNNPHCLAYLQDNKWMPYSLTYLDTTSIHPVDYYISNITGFGKKHIRINGAPLNLPADKDWADTTPVLDGVTWCNEVKIFDENTAWGNAEILLGHFHNDTTTIVTPFYQNNHTLTITMQMFDDRSAFLAFKRIDSAGKNYIGYFKNNEFVKIYPIPETPRLAKMHFADRNTGWIVGDSGLIMRYNPNDDSWEKVNSPVRESLIDVFTIDKNNAWCSGIGGTLLKWNGTSWNTVASNTTRRLYALYFVDKDHGWAVGQEGIIMKYKDGIWSRDTIIGNYNLNTIYMSDKNHGWAGGWYGTFLQYINTDTSKSERTAPPETFSTINPNPVGSQASIQFNTTLKGNVYINIYDQSGHLSATYNLGTLEAGSYSHKIATNGLLDGIYIYHIISSSGEKGSGRFVKQR